MSIEVKENGLPDGLPDLDDPEFQKQRMRPVDIDADMKEMERRKRVELIMSSRAFREELERIVEQQLRDGYSSSNLMVLQQLCETAGISSRSAFKGVNGSVIPINDIRGTDSMAYEKGERILRCKLAAVYRLVELFGWSQGIYNHITARISQDQEHFLINPFGLMYYEITASSLVKTDMQGNIIDTGTTSFGINLAGFTLHSAIHAARPDIKCIIHVHTPSVISIASSKTGLLFVSQEAAALGNISYHDYQGILINEQEKEELARNLGPVNKVMLLRNHGCVCCGETIEEAFFLLYALIYACEIQLSMMPLGIENMHLVSEKVAKQVYEVSHRSGGGGVNSSQEGMNTKKGEKKEIPVRQWKIGELEFEALMRMLDNGGFRTGYVYRQPQTRVESHRFKSDVEVPPAASSFHTSWDVDDIQNRKSQEKCRWLNSPNMYQKIEVLETGTDDPKKITKWITNGAQAHSTPVKIENNLQFVPKNTNPKEFKQKQKEIKENRRAGEISAGPQSQVLDGISWDEAKRIQEAISAGSGDQAIIVGAASKGIIQRDHQHNVIVYKTPYAKNPFDQISEEELQEYRELIERKQKGEPSSEIEDTDEISKQQQSSITASIIVTETSQPMSAVLIDSLQTPIQSPSDEEPDTTEHTEPIANGEDEVLQDQSISESSKKEKKKKKGLRTPSFLKMKSKEKKKADKSDTSH